MIRITEDKLDRIVRNVLREELTKSDVERVVSSKLSSSYDSREFKKAVKEVAAEAVENLFRTLWSHSTMWKGGMSK